MLFPPRQRHAEKTESPGEEIGTEALHCRGDDPPRQGWYYSIAGGAVTYASLCNAKRMSRTARQKLYNVGPS
jgi:hypothetical protein